MYVSLSKAAAVMSVAVALSLPIQAVAGSYGSSAVRDANVANTAQAGRTVPCPRLGQNVPANLAAQMDCAAATPQVAGERVRNRTSFFDRFRHNRKAPPAQADDDNPDGPSKPRVVTVSDKDPDPSPPTTSSGPVDKWDRLNELGVTQDNFHQQSDSFKDQFKDFRSQGNNRDWSEFDPD